MRKEHIHHLRCPRTKLPVNLLENEELIIEGGRVKSGFLIEPISGNSYPVIDFIPRFVEIDNYASSFGLEWNKHSKTQVDHHSGLSISEVRFFEATKWGRKLGGEKILEVGSGSGRFTTHAVSTGALVFSIDYSVAVEANYRNNGQNDNLVIVQASIYELPFEEQYFDKVFCFGVLQHTPDPRHSFHKLVSSIIPGGLIATDIYLMSITQVFLTPKYLLRLFTKNSEPELLYRNISRYINFIWPVARIISRIPYFGPRINWRLMVADYRQFFKISDEIVLKDMAILDTFDMLSPRYDYPVTKRTFEKWHELEQLINIDVKYGYNGIEARATKKTI